MSTLKLNIYFYSTMLFSLINWKLWNLIIMVNTKFQILGKNYGSNPNQSQKIKVVMADLYNRLCNCV